MTGPEVTAAVRQGAEAFENAWNDALDATDQSDPVAFIEGVFRKALDIALDVPQMAAAIVDHLLTDTLDGDSETLVCAGCGYVLVTGDPDDDRDPQAEHATHHAALTRAALIGEGS